MRAPLSYIVIVIGGTLALLEIGVRRWPFYRRGVVGTLTFLINTWVLLGLTMIALAAGMAAPLLKGGATRRGEGAETSVPPVAEAAR